MEMNLNAVKGSLASDICVSVPDTLSRHTIATKTLMIFSFSLLLQKRHYKNDKIAGYTRRALPFLTFNDQNVSFFFYFIIRLKNNIL